jgi:transcriptional regulator with GAF, ATPase, and Fis domain
VTLPTRDAVTDLRRRATELLPSLVALGFSRVVEPGRTSILYSYPFGLGEFVLPADAVSSAVVPGTTGRQGVGAAALDANPGGAFEMFLGQGHVRRLVAVDADAAAEPLRFWVGTLDEGELTDNQWHELEALAARGRETWHAPETEQSELARLRRLESTAALEPAVLHALDVREVFDRLSEAARRALPHDLLLLRLFSDDLTNITVYARSDRGSAIDTMRNAYPRAMVDAWSFDIVDDLVRHPYEAAQPPAKLGARSSIRLPIRLDGRVVGGLAILSFTEAAFSTADVPVARRLADHVAVGLSHQRLAEASRQAAILNERAANLDLLEGLLSALSGVLDIREVFERVSSITQAVLPHDALSILEVLDSGARARVHASHGLGDAAGSSYDIPLPVPALDDRAVDERIIDDYRDHPEYADGPGARAGMRSALFVSIRVEGRTFGGLNFYSRTPGRFTRADLLVARRVTDHVALALSHRRLADQARVTEELRARATNLALLDDLLATLTDDGDLRAVFERVSAAAGKVLPHDAAALLVQLSDGRHGRVYASRGVPADLPDVVEIPSDVIDTTEWDHDLFDDVTTASGSVYEASLGLRSLLRVAIRLDGRFAGLLTFASAAVGAFTPADVQIARRIADRLAVTLARDRELEAERRADEATERAARLEARVRALTDELDARTGYRRVIGESQSWRQVLTQATQVAATETTALLLGESGTGKEVVARFIHRASPRNGGPFVAINCAALPEQLLEAELFGYERGAFTGAAQAKPGQLEQASGGTLFLDEVGEMSLGAQAKFLRVLQEREFQRLGGTRVLRSQARVVAATNRDLPRAIELGQFREDLFYRLHVFPIRLPALRDRRSDILPLADAFLSEIGRSLGRPPGGISRDARETLNAYHWPGNVRELRNILERAAILCEGGLITAEHLGLHVAAAAPLPRHIASPTAAPAATPPASAGDLAGIEKTMIENALREARFNKSKAARALGVTRHQLYIRMRRHGLD